MRTRFCEATLSGKRIRKTSAVLRAPRKGLRGNARGILGGNFLGREKRKTKSKTENQIGNCLSHFSFLLIVQVQRDPPFGIRLRQNTNALDPVHPSTDGLSHPFARITFASSIKHQNIQSNFL